MSATWLAPLAMTKVGPIRAGIWFLSWQIICLTVAVGLFLIERSPVWAASYLVAGVIASRIGLWGLDLCAQIIIQDVCSSCSTLLILYLRNAGNRTRAPRVLLNCGKFTAKFFRTVFLRINGDLCAARSISVSSIDERPGCVYCCSALCEIRQKQKRPSVTQAWLFEGKRRTRVRSFVAE
jgi:hypothetical protein